MPSLSAPAHSGDNNTHVLGVPHSSSTLAVGCSVVGCLLWWTGTTSDSTGLAGRRPVPVATWHRPTAGLDSDQDSHPHSSQRWGHPQEEGAACLGCIYSSFPSADDQGCYQSRLEESPIHWARAAHSRHLLLFLAEGKAPLHHSAAVWQHLGTAWGPLLCQSEQHSPGPPESHQSCVLHR